jgi:hypothetical protein
MTGDTDLRASEYNKPENELVQDCQGKHFRLKREGKKEKEEKEKKKE